MPKSGLYVLQGINPAAVGDAPFDVKIIDIYDGIGRLFSPAQVHEMGGGPGGGLLLGYFSIGEAENYRDYFHGLPAADIGPENAASSGDFEVAYWTDTWKAIATDYVDRIIQAGYDGVFFDVIDAFEQPWAVMNAPGGAPAKAMVKLIEYLADHARAINPNFKIWVSNAEELLNNPAYLRTIDGIVKENLFYQDNGVAQPADETEYSLGLLDKALDAGKDVIAVEYVTGADKVGDVHAKAAAAGVGSYIAHPNLKGIDLEGVCAPPCYRGGTHILTEAGEVAIEDLAIGDRVVTLSGEAVTVKWIGCRYVDCTLHPDPYLVWPVRVRAGAFADDQPHRDLWLSPDHSVFVDDVLIPIKQLVNGRTVEQVPVNDVTYYHIELPRHDVLLAEGLPAESWLDTGNRETFDNGGPTQGAPKTWSDDAVAPLAVDETHVRPVWERLASRSAALGQPVETFAFTEDPGVYLLVDGGAIWPTESEGLRYTFILPVRTGPIQLVSRFGYPTDSRPWASDNRRLGICVNRIIWYDREGMRDFPIDHPALGQGWWEVEYDGGAPRRWTNGNAWLAPLPGAIAIEINCVASIVSRIPPRSLPEADSSQAKRALGFAMACQ